MKYLIHFLCVWVLPIALMGVHVLPLVFYFYTRKFSLLPQINTFVWLALPKIIDLFSTWEEEGDKEREGKKKGKQHPSVQLKVGSRDEAGGRIHRLRK